MTKGFKDKDGKFRPTGNSNNGVSSDKLRYEKNIKKSSMKLDSCKNCGVWLTPRTKYKGYDKELQAHIDRGNWSSAKELKKNFCATCIVNGHSDDIN